MKQLDFACWIGEKRLSPERLQRYYFFLRNSKVKRNKEAASRKIILSHIALGMSLVEEAGRRFPNKTDVFVSEMMYMLVYATKRISLGFIDHHGENPNVSGYLTEMVRGHLAKMGAKDRIMGIRLGTYRKGKHGISVPLNGHIFVVRKENANDLMEHIIHHCESELEEVIVKMRAASHNDEVIGDYVGLSKQRVGQIRSNLRNRIMETLK